MFLQTFIIVSYSFLLVFCAEYAQMYWKEGVYRCVGGCWHGFLEIQVRNFPFPADPSYETKNILGNIWFYK